jgi:hypothetical protein
LQPEPATETVSMIRTKRALPNGHPMAPRYTVGWPSR